MPITQYNSSVRQMSQSKFNSMKNASGKIPDLANQIVMTNSEDSNISCLRTEVIYDMTSSDASKNWGHTTGLLGGNTYNNSSINLYRYEAFKFVLDIYPNTLSDIGSSNMVVEMEHITLIDGKSKILGNVPYIQNGAWSDTYFRYEIQIGQNNISCQFYWTGAGAQSNNTKYRITKIYGVLKTPSMIYTGDELIAGNGISIENGVIKVDQNVLNSIDNKETIAGLNAVNISNTSFSSLRDCLSYLASDLTKTYYCYIGDAESSSFKNLVGNPTGFGNYTLCLIKPIGKLTNQNVGIYTGSVYQCIAVGTIVNKLAIGYIFNAENAINETTFSGWKVLF